jgi:hypothetical protein
LLTVASEGLKQPAICSETEWSWSDVRDVEHRELVRLEAIFSRSERGILLVIVSIVPS